MICRYKTFQITERRSLFFNMIRNIIRIFSANDFVNVSYVQAHWVADRLSALSRMLDCNWLFWPVSCSRKNPTLHTPDSAQEYIARLPSLPTSQLQTSICSVTINCGQPEKRDDNNNNNSRHSNHGQFLRRQQVHRPRPLCQLYQRGMRAKIVLSDVCGEAVLGMRPIGYHVEKNTAPMKYTWK